MKILYLAALLIVSLNILAQSPAPLVFRIAFGSCGHEDQAQPILDTAATHRPDLFVFLGDNIYGLPHHQRYAPTSA
ncbi:MAG: hypothetical protein HUU34_04950 [Saprospiraceae bacterium]|jgi:alkaline phosphatase D|nr:hypothetical protein [Saprospiraceae bacterium]